MAAMMDELMGALTGGTGGLGALLGGALGGGDEEKGKRASALGLEAIVGRLADNAKDPRGAAALRAAVDQHDGSAVDDVAARFGTPEATADGNKILGHVFGGREQEVTRKIAENSGLDIGAVAKMLPALAPVVMGMLAKKANQGDLDAGGLAGMLEQESDGFDIGDVLGMLGGGGKGGAAGAMSIFSRLKRLFFR